METIIHSQLKMVEEQFKVKVLYAVESGSRAWGIHSEDSDYDVRFIYIHSPEWYLSIDQGKKQETIELPISQSLDIHGWEITKALRLFRKSNPSLFEWLKSDIIYKKESSFIEQLQALEAEMFHPVVSFHHYFSMAKKNYRQHLQGSEVKTKIYFYVLRALLACQWIEKYKTFPPIDFHKLIDRLVLDSELNDEIKALIKQKQLGDILYKTTPILIIHTFIEHELSRLKASIQAIGVQKKEDPTEQLNELFRSTLKEVWGERYV